MDDKKKINEIPIDPTCHNLLVREANRRGLSVRAFAGALLENWATTWTPGDNSPLSDSDRFFWHHMETERIRLRRQQLSQMFAVYSENPTEDLADILEQECDYLGLDYGHLMVRTGTDPFSSIVAASRGTKFDRCLSWLTSLLNDHDGQIPVHVVLQLAQQEGYNKQMLDRVRRMVNSDKTTPDIISHKDGIGWTWTVVPQEDEDSVSVER